jgi:hypothetical protein
MEEKMYLREIGCQGVKCIQVDQNIVNGILRLPKKAWNLLCSWTIIKCAVKESCKKRHTKEQQAVVIVLSGLLPNTQCQPPGAWCWPPSSSVKLQLVMKHGSTVCQGMYRKAAESSQWLHEAQLIGLAQSLRSRLSAAVKADEWMNE